MAVADGGESMFRIAVRHNWAGVAYLVLEKGFDFCEAIQDTIKENKYQFVVTLLSKTSNDEHVRRPNELGQNALHIFAQQAANLNDTMLFKTIIKQLRRRGVDSRLQDKEGRTPLHYAAQAIAQNQNA